LLDLHTCIFLLLIYLKYYFFYLLVLGLLYVIGKSFLLILKKKFSIHGFYANIFASLTIGTIIFVTINSCIISSFRTVNLGFFLVFIFLLKELWVKKETAVEEIIPETRKAKRPASLILELLILPLILFSAEAIFLLNSSEFHFTIPPVDDIYYSNVSESLRLTGQENVYTTGNIFMEKYHGLVAYHYFELWLNAGISGMFGLINLCSLLMITYPVFYIIGLFGIFSIWEHYNRITFFQKAVSVCLLLAGGIYMPFLSSIPFYERTRIFSKFPMELLSKKISDLYIFGFASALFFIKKKDMLAVLCLIAMCVVSVTIMPAVLGGLVLFLILNFFLKFYSIGFLKKAFAYVISAVLFFFLLYYLGGNRNLQIIREEELFNLGQFADTNYRKNFFYIILMYPYLGLLSYLPLIALIAFLILRYKISLKQAPLRFLLFAFTGCFIALISCAFYNPLHDSFALYILPASVLLGLSAIVTLVYLFSNLEIKVKTRLKYFYGLLLALVLLFPVYGNFNFYKGRIGKKDNGYSEEYLIRVQNIAKEKVKNPVGVCLLAKSRIPVIAHTNTFLNIRGEYLKFSKEYYTTVNLSVLDIDTGYIPRDLKKVQKLLSYSVFFNFVEEQKRNNLFISTEQSKIDFIEKYKIDFIIAEPGAEVSQDILRNAEEIIEDPLSKERFILLYKF
jgi:hypothetical protein